MNLVHWSVKSTRNAEITYMLITNVSTRLFTRLMTNSRRVVA